MEDSEENSSPVALELTTLPPALSVYMRPKSTPEGSRARSFSGDMKAGDRLTRTDRLLQEVR